MQRSARTAHTIRPSRSGSSTMQLATGQAAWQIEHAKAPKHRSGSMTAIVLGAFLRGPLIIFVHMVIPNYRGSRFQVPGSGFRVPGSGFRVPVPGSRFRVPGSGFQVSGFGFQNLERGTWNLEPL